MTTGKVEVQVFEVLNQVGQGLALRPVIRVFLEIPQPPLAFLPMDVFDRVHRALLFCRNELAAQLYCTLTALVRASFALLLVARRLSAERLPSADRSQGIIHIAGFYRDCAASLGSVSSDRRMIIPQCQEQQASGS